MFTTPPLSVLTYSKISHQAFQDGLREAEAKQRLEDHIRIHNTDDAMHNVHLRLANACLRKTWNKLVPSKAAWHNAMTHKPSRKRNPVAGLTEAEQGRSLLRSMAKREGTILLGRSGWPPDNRVVDKLVQKGLAVRKRISTGPRSNWTQLTLTENGQKAAQALLSKT